MIQDVFAAIPIGILLAFLLGPVFFVLLETSVLKGIRAAMCFDLGVILADVVFILIAYFGTNAILEKLKDDPAFILFGGVLLAIYGIISFIQCKKTYLKEIDPSILTVDKKNYLGLIVKGFFLNFINIGVLGFWLGIVVVFGSQLLNDKSRIVVFFASILATYLIIDFIKVILAKQLNRFLTPKRIFLIKRGIAISMIVFGVGIIIKSLVPTNDNLLDQKVDQLMQQNKSETPRVP